MTTERQIELRLLKWAKKHHGHCYKFSSPGRRNVPDRICIFPNKKIVLIECKAPGKKPSDGQLREIERLRKFRCDVRVVSTFEDIERMDREMENPSELWRKLI